MKHRGKKDLRELRRNAYRAAKREWLAVPIDERPQRWTLWATIREIFGAIRWVLHCRKTQTAAYKRWKAAAWRPERIEKARGGNG